jgi:hypothetical protein
VTAGRSPASRRAVPKDLRRCYPAWPPAASATRRPPPSCAPPATASGFTEIEVMPWRTRCSAKAGRLEGAWPHSEEVMSEDFGTRR